MSYIQKATIQQSVLSQNISLSLRSIEGIYRLIGCIALLDSKKQP